MMATMMAVCMVTLTTSCSSNEDNPATQPGTEPEQSLPAARITATVRNDAAKATLNRLRVARNLPAMTDFPTDFELELIHEYRRELLGEGQLFFLYKRLNRPTILYADVEAVEEKVYTFPLPITETESAQREDNK